MRTGLWLSPPLLRRLRVRRLSSAEAADHAQWGSSAAAAWASRGCDSGDGGGGSSETFSAQEKTVATHSMPQQWAGLPGSSGSSASSGTSEAPARPGVALPAWRAGDLEDAFLAVSLLDARVRTLHLGAHL